MRTSWHIQKCGDTWYAWRNEWESIAAKTIEELMESIDKWNALDDHNAEDRIEPHGRVD